MTSKAQPRKKGPKAASPRSKMAGIAPWAGLGLVVVLLGLLAWFRPDRLWTMLTTRPAPLAEQPLSLTVVHTNDTWGYFLPCG